MNLEMLSNRMKNEGAASYTFMPNGDIIFWKPSQLGAAYINAIRKEGGTFFLLDPNWKLVTIPQNGIHPIDRLF